MTLEPWQHVRHVTRTARPLSDAWPVLSKTGSSHNGPAKSHGEIRREARENALACDGVVSCAWCRWSYTGALGEGMRRARAHRERRHADRVRRTPRKRSGYALPMKDAA